MHLAVTAQHPVAGHADGGVVSHALASSVYPMHTVMRPAIFATAFSSGLSAASAGGSSSVSGRPEITDVAAEAGVGQDEQVDPVVRRTLDHRLQLAGARDRCRGRSGPPTLPTVSSP